MKLRTSLALAALLPLVAPSAAAQCLTPDNLDGAPCCTPIDLNLPSFPPVSMGANAIWWDACSVASEDCASVSLGAPLPTPQCGHYTANLMVEDCFGVPNLFGTAVLDYTRTWEENSFAGVPYQVWRFALKADLGLASSGGSLPAPSALGTYPTVFYYGYVDYALDCATGVIESALVLYHGCDAFQHDPLLSSRPGVFDPFFTYAIVAPHTAADPFVPTTLPPSSGTLFSEAMRDAVSVIPDVCNAEERIVQGVLQPITQVCMCPLSFNFPPQQTVIRMSAAGVCGSNFTTLNVWPIVPWYELVTTALGRWSTASYPGPESAAVAEGLFLYSQVCPSSGVVSQSLDVFYGGETTNGFPVVPTDPTIPPPNHFLDMASNYSNPYPGPVALPLVGEVWDTDHLIYVNAF